MPRLCVRPVFCCCCCCCCGWCRCHCFKYIVSLDPFHYCNRPDPEIAERAAPACRVANHPRKNIRASPYCVCVLCVRVCVCAFTCFAPLGVYACLFHFAPSSLPPKRMRCSSERVVRCFLCRPSAVCAVDIVLDHFSLNPLVRARRRGGEDGSSKESKRKGPRN